jgi:uncharacterized protein (TIRG00374 family)
MARRTRRVLSLIAGMGVSAVFIYLSFRKVDLDEVTKEIVKINIALLTLALIPKVSTFMLASLRSRVLFARISQISYWRLFKSVLAAFAVNNIVPLRAGEVARVAYIARHGKLPASTCIAVIALERLMDMWCLLAIFVCLIPMVAADLPINATFFTLAAGIVGAMAGAIWVSRRPQSFVSLCTWFAKLFGRSVAKWVGSKAQMFADGMATIKSSRAVIGSMTVTLLMWTASVVTIRAYLWAFDLTLPWYAPLMILVFIAFGTAIPSTPGHVGTYHFFVISALGAMGIAKGPAASYAVVAHAMAVVPLTVIAVIILFGDYLEMRRAADQGHDHDPSRSS